MFRNGLLWGQMGPLMEAASGGEGEGGGGGDAGHGHDDGKGEGEGEGDGAGDGKQQSIDPSALANALKAVLPDLINPLLTQQMNGLDTKWEKRFKKLTVQDGDGKDGKTKSDPFKEDREKDLEQRLQQMEQEREADRKKSMERERDAEIKTALADFPWKDAEFKSLAFDYYQPKATRDEDGNLVIGGVALASFIKQHAAKSFKPYFAPRDVGGSGNSGGQGGGSKALTLDQIKPGMSADEDAKARAVLTDLYNASRQGQM